MGTVSVSQLFVISILLVLMFGDFSKIIGKIKKNLKDLKKK
jgi:hypothetical protein